jgi:hypothetical protein
LASQRNSDRQIKAEQIARGLSIIGASPALMGVVPLAFTEWWRAMDLPNLELVKMLIGYYPMMQQMMMAQQMQMTPQQMFMMQGMGQQQQPQGNSGAPPQPYQEGNSAPTNQEEMIATTNASMIQNSPTVY